MADASNLCKAMADLKEDVCIEILKDLIDNDGDINSALVAYQDGMKIVGERFESGEYYLGDLILAGEIMADAIDMLKPLLGDGAIGSKGKMLICTVQGDLHDIGKNIVKSMLEGSGFEVIDLGIDVPPAKIVETAKTENIKIIALSGVLTLALDSMANVVKAFKDAGLRDSVKIIIGGNPVTQIACKFIGADDWANNPQKGVEICTAWAVN